jgi:F0F1-type ATP synthase delta subunit
VRDFVARPWMQATARRTVAAEIAQRSGLSKLTSDFLALVAARGCADHLQAIAQKYRELVDKDLGRVRACASPSRSPMTSGRRCP